MGTRCPAASGAIAPRRRSPPRFSPRPVNSFLGFGFEINRATALNYDVKQLAACFLRGVFFGGSSPSPPSPRASTFARAFLRAFLSFWFSMGLGFNLWKLLNIHCRDKPSCAEAERIEHVENPGSRERIQTNPRMAIRSWSRWILLALWLFANFALGAAPRTFERREPPGAETARKPRGRGGRERGGRS